MGFRDHIREMVCFFFIFQNLHLGSFLLCSEDSLLIHSAGPSLGFRLQILLLLKLELENGPEVTFGKFLCTF